MGAIYDFPCYCLSLFFGTHVGGLLEVFSFNLFDFSYKSQYPSFSYEEKSFDFKNYKLKDSITLRKDFISKGITILKIQNENPEKICDEFKKLGDFFGRNQVRDATRRSSLDTEDNQTNIKTFDATEFPLNPEQPYDLVFVDPPYRKSLGEAAVRSALASNWISDNALIVLEEGEQKSALKGFKLEDIRRYGDTILHFFKRLPY